MSGPVSTGTGNR